MKQYQDLIEKTLKGSETLDRTGVGTVKIFGEQLKFDLLEGLPVVTVKKTAWKSALAELLWFIRGSSNVNELRAITFGEEFRFSDKQTIWDANYNKQAKDLGYTDGNLGPVYGSQWRNFTGVDQLKQVLQEAKQNPASRRLLVSAWNVPDLPKMALPPCHYGYQLNIDGNYLDMLFTMRSVDVMLGLPFDIASYAMFQSILARILGLRARFLCAQLGDVHIYKNHIEGAKQVLDLVPYGHPQFSIHPDFETLEQFERAKLEDFELLNYQHHPFIKLDMAV